MSDLSVETLKAGNQLLVQNFSITLHAGEILAIVGESGSGKSLACLAIMDLLPVALKRSRGSIEFNGRQLSHLSDVELSAYRGRKVAYVFQDPFQCLNPVLSLFAQLNEVYSAHFPSLSMSERFSRAVDLLNDLGLNDVASSNLKDRYPHQLSGGQRQRFLLALSLAAEPDVLIADEITTALDPKTQGSVIQLLKNMSEQRNFALIFISHDILLSKAISDSIVVMEKGEVIENGDFADVWSNPKATQTKRLIEAATKPHLPNQSGTNPDLALSARGLEIYYRVPRIFGRAKLKRAVSGIDFDLKRGQTLAIVGKSGSGKTTIGRAICGLAHQLGGKLSLHLDNEIVDLAAQDSQSLRAYRKHVSMVFQDPVASLNPMMSVAESVAEPFLVHTSLSSSQRTQRANSLLHEVGLEPAKYATRRPSELSGGQCQRVAIARALALDPKVVVCDEAISSLDIPSQHEIIELLTRLQEQRGLSYIFISHDLQLVDNIAHQILSLDEQH